MNSLYFVKFSDNIETILANSLRLSVVQMRPHPYLRYRYYSSHSPHTVHNGYIICTDDSMLICALTLCGNIAAVDHDECSARVIQQLHALFGNPL